MEGYTYKALLTKEPKKSNLLVEAFLMVDNIKIYRAIGWFDDKFQDILNILYDMIDDNFEVIDVIPNGVLCTITTKENITFTTGLANCTEQEYGDYLGNDSGTIIISKDFFNNNNDISNLAWMN